MGKGGVGKTTVATTIAVALARLGHTVHLSTTDPAAHLDQTLGYRVPNLSVSRIDPARETAEYTAEVMATAGKDLDEQGKALLEEDLRSPCTEEIAVFRAFARTVDQGKAASSCSTRLRPGTRCSCSTRPRPITATSCGT